jgi:hypothetical protein
MSLLEGKLSRTPTLSSKMQIGMCPVVFCNKIGLVEEGSRCRKATKVP